MMNWRVLCSAALLTVWAGTLAWAADESSPAPDEKKEEVVLEVGDDAPDFRFPAEISEDGKVEMQKLAEYKGKKNVLLAFYPKADTSGCTKQLCGYRDDFSMFEDEDTVVIAISTDKQDDSDAFKEKYEMPFYVIGDPRIEVVAKFGVPLMEHNEMKLAKRSVFLVDKEGKIALVDLDYSIDDDKDALYAAIKKVNAKTSEEKKES